MLLFGAGSHAFFHVGLGRRCVPVDRNTAEERSYPRVQRRTRHPLQRPAPSPMVSWSTSASLAALKGRKHRPVAAGDILKGPITSKALLATCDQGHAASHAAGREAVVHSMCRWLRCHSADEDRSVLTVDLKNAFNLIDRSCFLRVVRRVAPSLARYSHLLHGRKICLFRSQNIHSRRGVQQEDPLRPFLFAFCLQGPPSPLRGTNASFPRAVLGWRSPCSSETPAAAAHKPFATTSGLRTVPPQTLVWPPPAHDFKPRFTATQPGTQVNWTATNPFPNCATPTLWTR